jgi:hypothetical protein
MGMKAVFDSAGGEWKEAGFALWESTGFVGPVPRITTKSKFRAELGFRRMMPPHWP